MSDQMLRSGTSIGAMIKESQFAQSRADFVNKCSIALKEANETRYWIERIFKGKYFSKNEYDSLNKDINEIVAILIAIVRSTKNT